MTYKKTNIAIFSIVALFTVTSLGLSNAYAEESREYKMAGDVTPVLTFTFRDGIETHSFPVFNMGENFVSDSGVSFSVEGTVSNSPMLHKAMDEAYKYRFSNAAFDHQFKYFDVTADFLLVLAGFSAFVVRGTYPLWTLLLLVGMFLQFIH